MKVQCGEPKLGMATLGFVFKKLYDGHFISGLSFELNLIPIFCGLKKTLFDVLQCIIIHITFERSI